MKGHGVLLMAAAALASCAVGPDFKAPQVPASAGYGAQEPPARAPVAGTDGGQAQRVIVGGDIPHQWWMLFRSPALDQLVSDALERSPTLDAARAALRQAQELTAAARGSYSPQLAASYGFTRQRNATGTLAPTLTSGAEIFNLHTAQVSVSYLVDIWGGTRRQVESAAAQADYQRWELEAAYLTLTANVIAAAIQEASLRAQLAATQDIIKSERETTQILRHQYELGSIAQLDVMAQEASLAAAEATLPGLQKQLEQQRHLLAALTGRFPNDEPRERFELTGLKLPEEVPLSLPSTLVRQRPDVLAAEAQLHTATANVGVAIAGMLPQLNLSANQGGASTVLSSLTSPGNTFWVLGASLSQTLFEGGTLWHRKHAADAALDQAGAQYRGVVLAAFQNVADCLTALKLDAAAESASLRAEQAAAESLATTRHNVELGNMSYLALLSAEATYQQAALNLAQARASRYADTAALLVASGGGWWHDQPGS
jgi:NodT family efflux transporter outer membrane factor (OMF) lipoprotein